MTLFHLAHQQVLLLGLRVRIYRERQILATLDGDALWDLGLSEGDAAREAAKGVQIPRSRRQLLATRRPIGECRET